jgi:RNA polymerase sigma-70 factor (family 1)
MYEKFSDEELLSCLVEGNQKAFEAIYRRYWYRLYGVAYHEIGTKEEAEEILHDVFEKLWIIKEDVAIRNLSAYLVAAVKHRVTNYIKSQITQRKYQEYLILNELQQSYSTDEIVHFSDLSRAVDEVMKKLPERTCEVFRMSRFENLPVREIAHKLNISEKGVEYHITQSLKLLREQLRVYQTYN